MKPTASAAVVTWVATMLSPTICCLLKNSFRTQLDQLLHFLHELELAARVVAVQLLERAAYHFPLDERLQKIGEKMLPRSDALGVLLEVRMQRGDDGDRDALFRTVGKQVSAVHESPP